MERMHKELLLSRGWGVVVLMFLYFLEVRACQAQ